MSRKGPLTDEEKSQIRKLKREGKYAREIGVLLGRSGSTISDWAASVGIPFDNARGPKRGGSSGPMSEARREAIRDGLARKRGADT